eukprot:TRINITY_DN2680_c0_g1_i1.p1 TRINITY_DN2680_c0_g1~~TRINITY_DN2680_c0_g1_i1.p1  ORF type:complete len:184 (+),score=9.40 TRINITY_DN2680_c0_g1_i1:84-635(+)
MSCLNNFQLFVLVCMFSSFTVQSQPAITTCGGLLVGQNTIATEIYHPIQVPNANACQQLCTLIDECAHFSWYSDSGNCYMKSDSLYNENSTDIISGPTCTEASVVNGPCCGTSIDEGVDFAGGDIGAPISVDNPQICQLVCGLATRCRYFTFDDQTSGCYLKTLGFTATAKTITVSGKGCYTV